MCDIETYETMGSIKEKQPLLRDYAEDTISTATEISLDPTPRRKWIPLELVLSLYFISMMITMPVMQFYIYGQIAKEYGVEHFENSHETCGSSNSDNATNSTRNAGNHTERSHNDSHIIHQIQKDAADQFMYLSLVSSFPAVIPTLFLGSLSDKYGRKFSMLVTFSGLLVRQILYVAVIVGKWPYQILYVGNLIEGLTGYYGSALMSAFGILADITKPGKERALRITILECVVAVIVGLTALGTGFWIQYVGFISPMITAACLSLINLIIILILIPETNRNRDHQGSVCSCRYILRCFRFYYEDTADKRRRKMTICFVIVGLAVATNLGKSNVMTLFFLNEPLCWSVIHTQVYSAVSIFFSWGTGLLLLGFLQRSVSDVNLITMGNMFAMASYLVFTWASKDWIVYVGLVVATMSVTVIPMLRSLMSKLSSPDEQGAMFASISFIELLCTALSGLVYSPLYKATEATFPGCMFLVMAGFAFICCILCIPLSIWTRRDRGRLDVEVIVSVDGQDGRKAD